METQTTATRSDDGQEVRDLRGRQIAATRRIKRVGEMWAVPSEGRKPSVYLVDVVEQTCTCPDFQLRRTPCKHVHATLYWIAWGRDVGQDGNVTEAGSGKRKNYPRNWAAENGAATHEGEYVPRLLHDLCEGIEERQRKPGPGRNPFSRRAAAFAAVMKVYGGKPQRHLQSALRDFAEKGHLQRVGHFNRISDFLADPESTPLLVSLVEQSAKPLAIIEEGQFAIDSTGISTVGYERWFSQKHGALRSTHSWLKLHIMVGTLTHAITGVKISPDGDCPQFPELLAQTMKYFNVKEVSGDKAYASRKNYEILERFGVEGYLAFKVNAVVNRKYPAWSRKVSEFYFSPELFLRHYHRRSNVETVMRMIKQRFGNYLLSRLPVAQMNETLAKCICHNLAQVVRSIFKSGLAPRFWDTTVSAVVPTLALPTLADIEMPEEEEEEELVPGAAKARFVEVRS